MVEVAERMKAMRERRRARGLRELRLIVPDARSKSVRRLKRSPRRSPSSPPAAASYVNGAMIHVDGGRVAV